MDAHVLAGGEAEGEELRAENRVAAEVLAALFEHELQLLERLLHFDDGTRAVDKLEVWLLLQNV